MTLKKLVIFLTCALSACSSSMEPQPEAVGWEYFPLEVGRFQDYDVVDIDVADTDTARYQLRALITEKFDNLGGTESYVMLRFARDFPTDEWSFLSSWTIRRDYGRLVVYEENIPYLKISFPVSRGREWDGNSLNTSFEDTYEIIEEGVEVTLPDGLQIDGLTVLQEDLFDLIIQEEDFRQEQYASGIGLISRDIRQTVLRSDSSRSSGRIYSERLINYGVVE